MVEFWTKPKNSFDEAKAILETENYFLNLDLKKEMLSEVLRSIEGDEKENEEMWKELYNKIKNNEVFDDDNMGLINFDMQTGTVFRNFDYKKWILEQ